MSTRTIALRPDLIGRSKGIRAFHHSRQRDPNCCETSRLYPRPAIDVGFLEDKLLDIVGSLLLR